METIKRNKIAFIILAVVVIIPIIIVLCVLCFLFVLTALGVNTAQNAAVDTQRRNALNEISLIMVSHANYTGNESAFIDIPVCSEGIAVIGTSDYDLAKIVNYSNKIPQDPEVGSQSNTGYTICIEKSTITLEASHANNPPVVKSFDLQY